VLFVIGARLATDLVENPRRPTSCPEEEVTRLERAIDRLVRELSPQYYFLLPGGHPIVAACHVARTVCRRVERRVVTLEALAPVDEVVKRYLNRLSDYLFVLARYLARHFGVTELTWKP
jgi:cob(I)alamin adenosyltransferase